MRSNCLFFFLALRARRARKGKCGYFVMRRSHHCRWLPHILYQYWSGNRLRMVSFVPTDTSERWFIIFRGKVKWGD
jgi:hypothetical protein